MQAAVNLDQDLNPPQHEAVLHADGPMLVLAGAGSGKTRVITYRIAHLIQRGVPAYNILAVTFTNKAAGEMRERTSRLLGYDAKGLWIGTFHAICARLLRQYGEPLGLTRNFVIYDDADQVALIKRVLKDLQVPDRLFAPKEVRGRIDRLKNEGISPEQFEGGDYFSDLVAKIYPEYERRLTAANAVDFGNLLLKMLQLLRDDPDLTGYLAQRFVHLLVDEFQDTNCVQYELVRRLSSKYHNLCVVGDDDQSIYGWRGADIRNILGFEKDHPDAMVVKLEQNYRSTQIILSAATAVIRHNAGRRDKTLWTAQKGGKRIRCRCCEDERDEAFFVSSILARLRDEEQRKFGDFAVFYRTHSQSRVLEEAFRAARPSIPYAVVGGVRFYDRAEIKDLLAYLKVLINPADDTSLLRIINAPARGIGPGTIEKVNAFAQQRRLSFFNAGRICADPEAESGQGVLRTGPRRKLAAFYQMMDGLVAQAPSLKPSELADTVLEESGYLERLAVNDTPENESRAENLSELISSLRDYEDSEQEPTLVGYLERVTLASAVDTYDESEGQVTLMTVHSAKGLEFPVVFIVGMEEGLFPHGRALDDPQQMEEERRLAYVAITRARERLFLSHARQRWTFGHSSYNQRSEFIRNIPAELLAGIGPSRRQKRPGVRKAGPAGRGPGAGVKKSPWDKPLPQRNPDEVWVDSQYDQRPPEESAPIAEEGFRVGMSVTHVKFGPGQVRAITGAPPNQNLTIYFSTVGPKTIRAQFIKPG